MDAIWKCLRDFPVIRLMFDACILESGTFYSSHLFSLWQRSVCFENNILSFFYKVILEITKLKNFKRREKLGQNRSNYCGNQ